MQNSNIWLQEDICVWKPCLVFMSLIKYNPYYFICGCTRHRQTWNSVRTEAGSDTGVYWATTSSFFPLLLARLVAELRQAKRETRGRSSTHLSGKHNPSQVGLRELKLTKLVLVHLNVATQSGRTISQLAPQKVHPRVMLIEAGWRHQAGLEQPTATPTATAEKRGAQSHNMISSINRLLTTGF